MLKINKILSNLADRRPIFHSEADFQHALAWQIHLLKPDAKIRLEKPLSVKDNRIYVDIYLELGDQIHIIELKYKTRDCQVTVKGEEFNLFYQGATDLGRYDYLKDIQRLEKITRNDGMQGHAVFLTNDYLYWRPREDDSTIDTEFRIGEGVRLSGKREWRYEFSPGTVVGREDPIMLKKEHELTWDDYSDIQDVRFRYLTVEV